MPAAEAASGAPVDADAPALVVAGVVTYQPDEETLRPLLRALTPQVAVVVVVDNGSTGAALAAVRTACDEVGAHLVELGENRGIAAAQNVAADEARTAGATHLLLSDQDSEPDVDMVARLLAGWRAGVRRGERVGAVGPVSVDVRSTDEVMVYRAARWGPRRSPCEPDADHLVPAAFLLASGCLVPLPVLEEVGPFREDWFIDHVDLEWGLRARRAGLRLYAVTDALLEHRLGDRLVKLPGRAQEVHVHSSIRTYYLARNTVLLVRGDLMPWRWRLGYVVWLAKFAAFNVLLVPPRAERARRITRGIRDGLTNRLGPFA